MLRIVFVSLALLVSSGSALATNSVKGFNLTEIGDWKYDAKLDGGEKTAAQKMIDKLHALGVRHVNLNPRGIMRDPRGTEIIPVTPASERSEERNRYLRLMKYAKSKGMTVGIRPIFFVVGHDGRPVIERLPDGKEKIWWHGNIQPANPDKWFDSFRAYMDAYLLIAKLGNADEFTIGAELYSMTVGIEDQWERFAFGFPRNWLKLLNYARGKLPRGCRVMYDVNFTDDTTNHSGISSSGGEFERWRYRIVDLANPRDEQQRATWQDIVNFWKGLDAVGIDMYRSLAAQDQQIPTEYNDVVALLKETSDRYATQLDTALAEIESVVGVKKKVVFKEVGFKSVQNGFVDPFRYDTETASVPLNRAHQAAAFAAMFQSFWQPKWSWFDGFVFWDVSIDPSRHGANDKGFSPIGKTETEQILRANFR